MRKINIILQEILKILCVYLLIFVWIRYLLKKLVPSIFLSAVLTALVCGIWHFFTTKKKNKTRLKIKEQQDAQNMFLSLVFEKEPMDFFFKLAKTKHKDVIKHKSYICVMHEENKKTLLYFHPSFEGLSSTNLLSIYSKLKKENANKIVICCKNVSDKTLPSILSTFEEKIIILDEFMTYKYLYKYYNYFPKITKTLPQEKKWLLRDFCAYSFNKQRAKGYLFSALVLVICGIFVPATIYYSLVASVLVVFALISQFNPVYNRKMEEIF